MIVRIGVTYSSKEIEVEVGDDVGRDSVVKDVEAALAGGKVLWLPDRKGRTVGIPADKIAYLEIGTEAGERRVGFSAI